MKGSDTDESDARKRSVGDKSVPPLDWDDRQMKLGAHMLQSRPWSLFQQQLGRAVLHDESDHWSWSGVVNRGRGFSYLYIPYGPTARSPAAMGDALRSAQREARQVGADLIRIEPTGVEATELPGLGLSASPAVQPARTRLIDLSPDEQSLRKSVAAGHRSAINQAADRNLDISITSDPAEAASAIHLLKEAAADRAFRTHETFYYETLLESLLPVGFAKLGLVHAGGELISAAIVFDWGGTRAYGHAGNTSRARELKSSVPLVWNLTLDARANGMKRFDLWGVADPDVGKNHPWAGFSQFKRAFGGEDVVYTGTWDFPVRPVKTRLIRLGRNANRWVRQLGS